MNSLTKTNQSQTSQTSQTLTPPAKLNQTSDGSFMLKKLVARAFRKDQFGFRIKANRLVGRFDRLEEAIEHFTSHASKEGFIEGAVYYPNAKHQVLNRYHSVVYTHEAPRTMFEGLTGVAVGGYPNLSAESSIYRYQSQFQAPAITTASALVERGPRSAIGHRMVGYPVSEAFNDHMSAYERFDELQHHKGFIEGAMFRSRYEAQYQVVTYHDRPMLGTGTVVVGAYPNLTAACELYLFQSQPSQALRRKEHGTYFAF